jgi:hypothetical protein
MTERTIRAVAMLNAEAGQEQALVDFTSESLASMRTLRVNTRLRSAGRFPTPDRLFSIIGGTVPVTRSATSLGPEFARIAPGLRALVD